MIWVAIILGLVQGLTEFIPVSSSGHLVLIERLMGLQADNFHLLLQWINIGTLLALLIYFRHDLVKLAGDLFKRRNFKLFRNIIITSIPAGLIGFLLADFISDNSFFNGAWTTLAAMELIGAVMILVHKIPKMKKVKSGEKLTAKQAFYIGAAQVLALIPGVSRSGSTIIMGRIVGLDNSQSARYSFLASLPIMMGVVLNVFIRDSAREYLYDNLILVIVGNAVAFTAGVFALKFIFHFLKHKDALPRFGWYRVVVAFVAAGVFLL